MALTKALEKWPSVPWHEIKARVEQAIQTLRREGDDWCPRQDSNQRRAV
jgi:hypothetical protein